MLKKSNLIAFLFITIFSLYAMKALIHPGFYTSHDGWHQVARLYHFDKAIKDGQFPPRWSGDLLNGFGYPLFIFSYHLPWLLAEPLVILGVSIFDAIKVVFIITFVLSGLIMFFWIKEMWGVFAGLVSSILYLFTPYRFANIFVRAAIGESVSFVFIPLFFWSLYRLGKKYSFFSVLLGAISLCGILLSHVIMTWLFLIPSSLVFGLFFYFANKRLKYLKSVVMMILLGLGLAAYYLIPAIAYKPVTVFANLYHDLYKNNFTPISKLLYSPWGYGALGTSGEMSRQVGLTLWFVFFLCLVLTIIVLVFKKRKFDRNIGLGIGFILSFILAVVLMTKSSQTIWKMVEPFALIDYPWRFLAITTLVGSALAGYATIFFTKKIKVLFVIFLMLFAWYSNRNHLRINQYTDIPLSLYISSELTTNTDDEYLPKWVNRQLATKQTEAVKLVQGNYSDLQRSTKHISFAYSSDVNTQATIHQMYFPGWQARDEQELKIEKSDYGGMTLILPKGKHLIDLKYRPTIVMRIGEMLSISSIAFIVISLFRIYKNNKLKA